MKTKKYLIVLIFFINLVSFNNFLQSLSHFAQAGETEKSISTQYRVITDIDDTIKMTHVRSPIQAIRNGFFGNKVFLGMYELYNEISKNAKSWTYLSGSPQSLEYKLRYALVTRLGFPEGEFILNNWYRWESSKVFKAREIERIRGQSVLPVIAFGDDTEYDAEVLDQMLQEWPKEQVLRVYIHRVTGQVISPAVKSFSTAFDVALEEFEQGRFTEGQVLRVGNAILSAERLDFVFPYFKVCPTFLNDEIGPIAKASQDISVLAETLRDQIHDYCRSRSL